MSMPTELESEPGAPTVQRTVYTSAEHVHVRWCGKCRASSNRHCRCTVDRQRDTIQEISLEPAEGRDLSLRCKVKMRWPGLLGHDVTGVEQQTDPHGYRQCRSSTGKL